MKINHKTFFSIIIAFVCFFITACNSIGKLLPPTSTPTLSPEQIYKSGIIGALQAYSDWQNGSLQIWNGLYDEKYQFEMMFCAGFGPKMGGCLNNESMKEILINLLEPIKNVEEDGFKVKMKFGGLTPPPEVSVAHNQIMACIEAQLAWFSGMEELITNGKEFNIVDTDSCKMVDVAINEIQTYVSSQ